MPTIKVSIPATMSGNTGQRDAFESHTNDYEVVVDREDPDKIKLAGGGYAARSLEFDLADLIDARRIVVAAWEAEPRAGRT